MRTAVVFVSLVTVEHGTVVRWRRPRRAETVRSGPLFG